MPVPHSLRVALVVVFIALIGAVVPVQGDSSRRSTIEGGKRVGGFELGKKFSEYKKLLGTATSTTQSDVSENAKLVYYKQFGMWFFVKKDLINGITVASPLFTTTEGVKVGSSQGDVTSAYGQPLSTARSNDVLYPEKGIGFSFENGRVARIYVFDKEERDLARGDARIVPGSRVGGLQLGQHIDFVLKQWKNPTQRVPLPNKPGAEMWSYKSKGVIVIVNNGRVEGLRIFSKDFRTGQDIRVGSSRDDVVRIYGKPARTEEGYELYPTRGLAFGYEKEIVKEIWVLETYDGPPGPSTKGGK